MLLDVPNPSAAPETAPDPDLDDLDDLADEITTMAAHLSAGTARWLELVGEFDARSGWAPWGAKSCAHWVAWRCSMAPGPAREHVRVARRLRELPLVAAAFARGELSYSKVRALTRVGPVADEERLLELALDMTAAQLERLVRAYRGVTAEDADHAAARRHLWLTSDDDGTVIVRGRLMAEDGALLRRALEAARDTLGVPAGTPPDAADNHAYDPDGARLADALTALADAFLARDPAERTGGDRHEVVIHVDEATLAAPRCELEDGTPLAAEVARRIACDASVVALSERDGQPVAVGRRTRSIPPGLRRALRARDVCCQFPGCAQRRWLDAHHIQHWAHGGATDLDNLVHLCRRHHRLVHEGGFTLSLDTDRAPVFRDPSGRVLPPAPRPPGSEPTALRARNDRDGVSVDAETSVPNWLGDPLELAPAVDALLGICATDVPAGTPTARPAPRASGPPPAAPAS